MVTLLHKHSHSKILIHYNQTGEGRLGRTDNHIKLSHTNILINIGHTAPAPLSKDSLKQQRNAFGGGELVNFSILFVFQSLKLIMHPFKSSAPQITAHKAFVKNGIFHAE